MAKAVVEFPRDRLIGYLHVLEDDERPHFHGRFKKDGELLAENSNSGWRMLGEAQGTVSVPEVGFTLLEVLPNEARDLSPLSELAEHGLQGIWLGNTHVNDQQMMHLAKLYGLQWIDVQNNGNVTDQGISYLKDLVNLKYFGAHWTRLSDKSLQLLATLPKLTYVDIWGCEVSDEAITDFKSKQPCCELRTE